MCCSAQNSAKSVGLSIITTESRVSAYGKFTPCSSNRLVLNILNWTECLSGRGVRHIPPCKEDNATIDWFSHRRAPLLFGLIGGVFGIWVAADNTGPPEEGDTDSAHLGLHFPVPAPSPRHCTCQRAFFSLWPREEYRQLNKMLRESPPR